MAFFHTCNMLEQPQTGLISRFYRQVENRLKNSDVYNVHAVKGKCGILIVQEKNGENVPICVGIIIISIIVYFLPRVFWSVLGHDWWFKDFKGGWIRPCHSLQRSTLVQL